ncbi:MAG TPA: hypothetical protein VK680_01280 [Solirubrobacteraceae bacterium]|nr:hypothetical protein [Solirubrobacteraceae bacterium]
MSTMRTPNGLVVLATLVVLAMCSAASASTTTPGSAKTPKPTSAERKLLSSHELWATIDVCDPVDEPNTVGIRGSMPGDGKASQKMYMTFRLQYLNAHKLWVDVASGASSSFVAVGSGAAARQGGATFDLKPVNGQPPVTLRGVVDFQWRHGKTVMLSATRTSTVGHQSLAGADPANFSAATCVIG